MPVADSWGDNDPVFQPPQAVASAGSGEVDNSGRLVVRPKGRAGDPRGIRNNNPLNIEAGRFTQGQPGYSGSDGRFAQFETPEHGIAAAEGLIDVYHQKHGLNTISGIINRWAPASDGNPVSAYANSVAKDVGVDPNQPLDLSNPALKRGVVLAMGKFENGRPIDNLAGGNPVNQTATDFSSQSKPSDSWGDSDPVVNAKPQTFANRFEGDGSLAQKPTTDSSQRMAIDFNNEGIAASQFSNPRVAENPKNLISDNVQQGDDGNAYFVDPKTGKLVQANSSQHVILTDSKDNKLKVYARTPDTNEGGLAAGGRFIRMGMNAPATSGIMRAAAAAPVLSEGQQVSQAAERLGVELPRAVTSDTTGVQHYGKILSNVPIGGTPLRQASQTAIGQLENAAQGAREAYGSGSIVNAGQGIREGVSEAIKSGPIKQRVNELYTTVDNLVEAGNGPATIGPLANTRNVAGVIEARRLNGALPQSAKVAELDEALSRPGMNYEGIKTLRSYFGEMLDGSKEIPQGLGISEVKQIYGALSKDMRIVIARSGGQDALRAYDVAERSAAKWANIREDLQRILDVKSDEGIFAKIVSAAGTKSTADIKMLGRVRAAVGPDKWNEVASAIIEKLGKAPDGSFSPDRLIGPSGLGGLSKEGKQILFRSTGNGSHADAIDDIATVAKRFKELNQFANPSGTGQTVIGFEAAKGFLVDPVTAVTSIIGARIFSSVLARPSTSRSMAAWSRAYERVITKPTQASFEGFKQASKLFASNIGHEVARPDLVGSLTKQLQGAVPAAADNEQQ